MTISGSNLYVANAYSDSLSVIDLNTDKVVRTIDLSVPIAGGVFGSGPNGVAVTDDGQAYVTLGQANAVAVVNLQGRDAIRSSVTFRPAISRPPSPMTRRRSNWWSPTTRAWSRAFRARSDGLTGFNTHRIPEPSI